MYLPAYKDPRGGHNRNRVNHVFFQTWSPKMAYVLGLVYSDGSIFDTQKSSRTCYLSIAINDIELLEQVREAMESNHQLYLRPSHLQKFLDGKTYLSKDTYKLRIGSKSIYNDLLNLGLTPRKSLSVEFPNVPAEYLSFFIRGYFDGDGCLHLRKGRYPRVIFTCGSINFINILASTLKEILQLQDGSISKQIQDSGNPCYRLYYSTKSSKQVLEFMYKDLNRAPYLKRKYEIYRKLPKN